MAEISRRKLYKYQPYNVQTLDNLKKRIVWFSKPNAFNDPFDLAIAPRIKDLVEQELQKILSAYLKAHPEDEAEFKRAYLTNGRPNEAFRKMTEESAAKFAQKTLGREQERGIACFSETAKDILMWAHYADGHRGFCLELDMKYPPFNTARPVIYKEEYPTYDVAEAALSQKLDIDAWLFTKSVHWGYEREWRIYKVDGPGECVFDEHALTGVYFGCAMPKEHKHIIGMVLNRLAQVSRVPIFFEMDRSKTGYSLQPRLSFQLA